MSEDSLMSYVGILLDCEVLLWLCFFISLTTKSYCYFLETKIRVLYLILIIFIGRNTRMMILHFDD